MRAFELALDEGADGVELDVRLCRSGEVLVLHDPDLWRVSGDPRAVANVSWRDVCAVDVGGGERVPRLDDALDLVLGRGGEVNVEVKGDTPDRVGTARAVARVLRRRGPQGGGVILSSFDPLTLLVLREELPSVPVAFLFDREHTGALRGAVMRRWLRPQGLHPQDALATPAAIRRWKRRGLFVNVWTVDDPGRVRALAGAGVDGIITDDVVEARRALFG